MAVEEVVDPLEKDISHFFMFDLGQRHKAFHSIREDSLTELEGDWPKTLEVRHEMIDDVLFESYKLSMFYAR